jgi:hypothetical protein
MGAVWTLKMRPTTVPSASTFDSGNPDKAPTIKSELLSARYNALSGQCIVRESNKQSHFDHYVEWHVAATQ